MRTISLRSAQLDNDNYAMVECCVPPTDPEMPTSFTASTLSNVVRAKILNFFTFKRLPFDQTEVSKISRVWSGASGLVGRGDLTSACLYFERDFEVRESRVSRWGLVSTV